MGLFLVVLVLGVFVLLLGTVTVALVLALLPGRHGRSAHDRDDASSPLEAAQAAAALLTPAEWEEFRRWVNGRPALPASQEHGITR